MAWILIAIGMKVIMELSISAYLDKYKQSQKNSPKTGFGKGLV